MSCCGQSRMNATIPPRTSGVEPVSRNVRIAYLGNNSLNVRGTFTGRTYGFSPVRRVLLVDANDSRAMLRSRFFRRA